MHESDPDDQLAVEMETNEACLQCHENLRQDLSAHTHHAADSTGSLCYNCHMPYTNYGLFKATRSHQITSPIVTSIEHKSRPNACNLCHLDQSLQWTAENLNEWFHQPVPDLKEDERTTSAWALLSLRGDAGQRAVAAWHPRWDAAKNTSGTEWLKPILSQLESDPYAAVSYVARASAKRVGVDNTSKPETDTETELQTRTSLGISGGETVEEFIRKILANRDEKPIASVE